MGPPIGMMHKLAAGEGLALVKGLFQGIKNKVRPCRARHAPADDASGKGVDHEGDVHKAAPGRDIGEVAEQSIFGRGALKMRFTRSSGLGAEVSLVVVRTLWPRTTPFRPICRIRRETVQRANVEALALHLPPDLPDAVDAEVFGKDAANLPAKLASRRSRAGARLGSAPSGRRARDRSTGRSAEPGRSARPRRPHGSRR